MEYYSHATGISLNMIPERKFTQKSVWETDPTFLQDYRGYRIDYLPAGTFAGCGGTTEICSKGATM